MSKYKRAKERLILAEKRIRDSEKEIRQLKATLAKTNRLLQDIKNTLENTAYRDELFFWSQYKNPDETQDEMRGRFYQELYAARKPIRQFQSIGFLLLKEFDRICRDNDIEYWLSFGGLLGAVRAGKLIPWDDDVDVCMTRDQYLKLLSVADNSGDFETRNFYGSIRKDNIDHLCKFGFRNPDIRNPDLDIFIYDYCPEITDELMEKRAALRKRMVADALDAYAAQGYDGEDAFIYPGDPITNVCDSYLQACADELGFTTRDKAEAIMWSLDNFNYNPGFHSSAPVSEVFPLSEVVLEGCTFLAPHDTDKYLRRLYGDYYSIPKDMITHRHFKMTPELEEKFNQVFEKYPPLDMD